MAFTANSHTIGTTGIDGVLADVKGAEIVSITHVAYKPKKVKVGQGGHVVILFQKFTVDRAYVTKDELKQIKKANKMKMTYQSILDFERGHKIPAVSADLQKRISEIVK